MALMCHYLDAHVHYTGLTSSSVKDVDFVLMPLPAVATLVLLHRAVQGLSDLYSVSLTR